MIEPILLGGGKRIFPDDGMARPLQLVKCVTAGTGVQVCTYRPRRKIVRLSPHPSVCCRPSACGRMPRSRHSDQAVSSWA